MFEMETGLRDENVLRDVSLHDLPGYECGTACVYIKCGFAITIKAPRKKGKPVVEDATAAICNGMSRVSVEESARNTPKSGIIVKILCTIEMDNFLMDESLVVVREVTEKGVEVGDEMTVCGVRLQPCLMPHEQFMIDFFQSSLNRTGGPPKYSNSYHVFEETLWLDRIEVELKAVQHLTTDDELISNHPRVMSTYADLQKNSQEVKNLAFKYRSLIQAGAEKSDGLTKMYYDDMASFVSVRVIG